MTNTDKASVGEGDLLERETVEIGARKFTRLRSAPGNALGQYSNKYLLVQDLFRDMGAVRSWRPAILECGIPADLERRRNMMTPDYYAAVAQKLGVEPSLYDHTNSRACFGFFLAEFGYHDGQYWLKLKDGDPDGAMQDAVTIGRLFELHRWRDEGHDLGAVQQARFSSGRDKKKGAKAVRALKDSRRQAIVEMVDKLGDAPRFETGKKAGKVDFYEWARLVKEKAALRSVLAHQKGNYAKVAILNEIARQTERTVVDAIKTAIQRDEIGKIK